MDQALLQTVGEILRDMHDGELSRISETAPAYKKRMAFLMELHLGLAAREIRYQQTLKAIERLTMDVRHLQSRLRTAEVCLTEERRRVAELEAGNGAD